MVIVIFFLALIHPSYLDHPIYC